MIQFLEFRMSHIWNHILTQRISSSFLGSVSSGGSGFAFPFPFPFLARALLRGALAGLFGFSWAAAPEAAVFAMAPAGWPSRIKQGKRSSSLMKS